VQIRATSAFLDLFRACLDHAAAAPDPFDRPGGSRGRGTLPTISLIW
jgi:hypothetical protein